jgi:hypothetical protein
MKQILPILTLTTLTAAAFANAGAAAPAAAASGLSYNRVGISRSGQDTNLSVSGLLGSSNFLATVETSSGLVGVNTAVSNGKNTADSVGFSVGYVFKNVVAGIDATVSVGAGNAGVGSSVGVNLRRALNEVVSGLEVAIGYKQQETDSEGDAGITSGIIPNGKASATTYEIAYNINKQFSVAYAITDFGSDASGLDNAHTVAVRYNY